MAKEALLDQVPISAACIYRVRGEIEPHEAAEEYEALIKNVFHVPMPSFHLILLGVGEDGHTASLFPGTQAMDEKDRLVAANPAPSGGASRITFTLPLINAAKVVAFLVTGGTKAEVLQQVLQPSPGHPALPASLVRPDSGKLVWFMDGAAASQLKEVKV